MAKMSPFHILHVTPGLGPGGMELAMARVIIGLTKDGWRHSIACLKEESHIADLLPKDTEIHLFHARPNELKLPFRLARLIRRIRPDVIHARNWGAWPDTVAARWLMRHKPPLLLSFHGLGKAGFMPLRRRLASKVLAWSATHLFTVSEASRQLMISQWHWPADKTSVIPNGLDMNLFCPAPQPPRNSRLIIGSVGNLRPVKNHTLIIRAAARLVRQGVDLEVRIAGEGEERPILENLARQLDFTDRIRLPGRVQNIPAFLHQLDIFILSSDSEQHPNALNEAMACALPCIATRVGSVAEMLDAGRCGVIIEPGDEAALAVAIDTLRRDAQQRRKFAQAARARACEKYSLGAMLTAYESLYRRLAQKDAVVL
ncbi:MAG: glycosyltransferase family 4 protein [Sedimentisphaerales bacterium]|nr:glycosyltransferase family 4 protein [Sedimentisphaerales bacterium]